MANLRRVALCGLCALTLYHHHLLMGRPPVVVVQAPAPAPAVTAGQLVDQLNAALQRRIDALTPKSKAKP